MQGLTKNKAERKVRLSELLKMVDLNEEHATDSHTNFPEDNVKESGLRERSV